MGDLEDLLLEAAGRTTKNRRSRPPIRRQREGSSSDNGSESREDDSDDDQAYASRKRPVFEVPLKKRIEPPVKDDEDSEGDDDYKDDNQHGDSSDESGFGSDLYKDEYDKEQLAQMTELDREMILSERAQKRDDQLLAERLRAKQSGKKAQPVKETPPPLSHLRSSARSTEKAAKNEALKELRERRLKRQDPVSHKSRDAARVDNSVGRDFSPSRADSSSESDNRTGSPGRNEGSPGDEDLDDIDEIGNLNKEVKSYDDIKDITIRRSKLAKWFMEPFFEELIVGCFVRVGIGRRNNKSYYRLCMVKNVDATAPHLQYELESKRTHKYLNVMWGKHEARWKMAVISDSPPTESEFKEWVNAMKEAGTRMPSQHDVLEKQEAIQKAVTYVYSPATVKQMLQEKKSASSRPLNIAAEKDRLRKALDVAETQEDDTEIERIQERLKELDAMSRQAKEKDERAVKLAEMNKKNKFENFMNASLLKPGNAGLKAGDAGYDPFSRRKTRSNNYYQANPAGANEAAASADGNDVAASKGVGGSNGAGALGTLESGRLRTTAAQEAAAGAGKLVDTSAPVDRGTELNSLHDFDLRISLTKLQTLGGPQGVQKAFMARKQKIEATVGYQVPEDDGKKHTHMLSISDYKRRRGLL